MIGEQSMTTSTHMNINGVRGAPVEDSTTAHSAVLTMAIHEANSGP